MGTAEREVLRNADFTAWQVVNIWVAGAPSFVVPAVVQRLLVLRHMQVR